MRDLPENDCGSVFRLGRMLKHTKIDSNREVFDRSIYSFFFL